MEWKVQISGDGFVLDELAKASAHSSFAVLKEEDGYFLTSVEFAIFQQYEELKKSAERLLSFINGASRLILGTRKPIGIAGISRIKEDGTKEMFVDVHDTVHMLVSTNVTLVKSNGTIEEIHRADPILGWVQAAKRNDNVAKVFRLLGEGEWDWVALYRILEVVEDDVGGHKQIIKNGWTTEASFRRFKHTANSVTAVGDKARHGKERTTSPKNPMTIFEARSFIEMILQSWLNSRYPLP